MKNSKYHYDEDKPLLVLALDSENFTQPVCETAVTRGAVNYLGRWPAHVLAAFVAGCLVFATFLLFGVITAIFTGPSGERTIRNLEFSDPPNVYFIKHENHTWSPEELCYIETTARTYRNLSVYLINLISDNRTVGRLSKVMIRVLEVRDRLSAYGAPITVRILGPETPKRKRASIDDESRESLATFNANIKNLDVPIRQFFNGSRLYNVCNHLDERMMEMAARAQILWNFPGVALDPAMYPSLQFFKGYLCKGDTGDNCVRESAATVELNGDIQAASVPCQAFIGELIREISISQLTDQEETLKRAIGSFCPRSRKCLGVRLLNRVAENRIPPGKLNCPTIMPISMESRIEVVDKNPRNSSEASRAQDDTSN